MSHVPQYLSPWPDSSQCNDCPYDGREENDAFFGVWYLLMFRWGTYPRFYSLIPSIARAWNVLLAPTRMACTSARSMDLQVCSTLGFWHWANLKSFIACNQCFGWKKQLTRARVAAKKAGKA